jgi:hypothetical protein
MNEYKNNQPVMDEETKLRESPAIGEKGTAKGKMLRNWKDVTIGGVSGIMVGAAGVIAAHAFPPSHSADSGVTVHETPAAETKEEIAVANSVSDDMSFREAIEAAREEVGPGGAFSWHGDVYSAYKADDPEWIEMGPEGQKAHCKEIVEQVQAEPYVEEVPYVEPDEEVFEEESVEEPNFEDESTSDEQLVDEQLVEEEPAEDESPEEEELSFEEGLVEEEPDEEEPDEEEEVVVEEAPVEEEHADELIAEVIETPVEEVVEEEHVTAEEPVAVEEPVVEAEKEASAAEEPEEAPTEEPAEESAPEPVWKHLEKPTIEQIIKLYKASVPVMKSEPEVEIKILDIEKNDDEPVQPVDVKASNDVAAESNGGVKVDIFSEVREIANEDDNGMDEVASADDLLQ